MKGKDLKDVVKIYNDTPEENEKKTERRGRKVCKTKRMGFGVKKY